MSYERIVQRSRLGRLVGLRPKVYRCHGLDGVWRRDHEPPMWSIGFYGPTVPCIHCFRHVIPNTGRPKAL